MVKTNIYYIWESLVEHHYVNATDRHTADFHVKQMIDLMRCSDIKMLDDDPNLIDRLKQELIEYIIPSGKNKGRNYTPRTIKECFRLLRQIVKTADDHFKLKNTEKLLKKLSFANFKNTKQLSIRKTRVALSDEDLKKLFTFMKDIKNKKFSSLNFMLKLHPEFKGLITKVKENPEHFYYAILIALFTGSRANAITTLRHKDIDLESNTFSFMKDSHDSLDQYKHLKTLESNRIVPISKTLMEDLKFKEFVQKHLKTHDQDSFIFEESIRTRDSYKPSYINECVNVIFQMLEIKPSKDSNFMKDFHSLKKNFYSSNLKTNIPLEMLEAIAGNKHEDKGIAAKVYVQISMETSPQAMIDAVNQITYPYIEILTGKTVSSPRPGTLAYNLNIQTDEQLKEMISKYIGQPVKGIVFF